MKLLAITISCLFSMALLAQNSFGEITGYLFETEKETSQPAAYAKVWVDNNGSKIGATTDETGKFRISAVPSGIYVLEANYSGDTLTKSVSFEVFSNQIRNIDRINVLYNVNVQDDFVVLAMPTDLINIDDVGEMRISAKELAVSPNLRSPADLITGKNSAIKQDENGQMMIRGARAGDLGYYIDGVKLDNAASLPGAAIGGVTIYTSAIPAKYGDTNGGVIIMESKSYSDLYRRWKIMTTREN